MCIIFRSIICFLCLLSYAQDGVANSSFIDNALATGNFSILGAALSQFGNVSVLLVRLDCHFVEICTQSNSFSLLLVTCIETSFAQASIGGQASK